MKYVLLTLFVTLVCSCDNYIPYVKKYDGDTKSLNGKDSIGSDKGSSIIIDIDSSSHNYDYVINIPSK